MEVCVSRLRLEGFVYRRGLSLSFNDKIGCLMNSGGSKGAAILETLRCLRSNIAGKRSVDRCQCRTLNTSGRRISAIPIIIATSVIFRQDRIPPRYLTSSSPRCGSGTSKRLLGSTICSPLYPCIFFSGGAGRCLLHIQQDSTAIALRGRSGNGTDALKVGSVKIFSGQGGQRSRCAGTANVSTGVRHLFSPVFI